MQRAIVPRIIAYAPARSAYEFWAVVCGLMLMSALAQITLPLPWTAIPLTGQTFGCILIGLGWGWKRAAIVLGAYLLLGAAGLPVFADGSSGLFGPTGGYLAGMFLAGCLTGYLAERGWTLNFRRAFFAANLGLVLIYGLGLLVLSRYLPPDRLLEAGLLPFLPGDILKNALAAFLVRRAAKVAGI